MRKLIWALGAAALVSAQLITGGADAAARRPLVIGMALEPPHLDPTAGAAAAIDEVVYANVFEGLTRLDQNGAVQPQLATDWTVSDDGLTYTFNLKPGVKFHDGTDFDAEDVVFSLNRARTSPENAQPQLFSAIDTVEAIDPLTVRITLSRPEGSLTFNLGWGDAVIVAPESADTDKTNPIGTGPFKFSRWVRGDRVELVPADDRAMLGKVTFKFISEPSAQIAALLAGDVDAFPNLNAREAVPQFQADPRFEVVVGTTEGETLLSTNNGHAPFNDIRVRQAIAHAIDRNELIQGSEFGFGTPIGSHFAPHNPAYVDLTNTYPLDLDAARKLLTEAGYPDGFKATIKLPPPAYARRGGEIIAAQLKRIGIDLEIIPVEWAQWLDQVFRGDDYDLTIVSHTEPLDIGIYARDKYYFNYHSDEFNKIIADLDKTSDPAGRAALYGEAQKVLARDAVNGFLLQLAKIGVWNKDVKGLWHNRPIQANDVTGVSWAN